MLGQLRTREYKICSWDPVVDRPKRELKLPWNCTRCVSHEMAGIFWPLLSSLPGKKELFWSETVLPDVVQPKVQPCLNQLKGGAKGNDSIQILSVAKTFLMQRNKVRTQQSCGRYWGKWQGLIFAYTVWALCCPPRPLQPPNRLKGQIWVQVIIEDLN